METDGIRSILGNVTKRLEALDTDLKGFEQTVKDEESLISELKKKYRAYESDAQMNLSQVKKSEERLRQVKTNKEYQSLLKEIEESKKKGSQIEDKMLEYLYRIDESERVVATRRDEYLRLKDQVNSKKEIIEQEAERNEERLARLDTERSGVSSMVGQELMKKYIMIKTQQAGEVAIAPVKDAICHGCNVNLPPQMYNELRHCNSLMFCPNCQRIIYWKKNRK